MENHDRSKRRRVIAESFTESNGVLVNSDITENILSRIPIEFVSRTRAVCNLWKNHLKMPKKGFLFTGSFEGWDEENCVDDRIRYGDEYSGEEVNVSYKSLALINHGLGQNRYIRVIYGSCNGLVCLPDDEKMDLVYICNPMTGEYIYLPEMDLGGISNPNVFGGFGYSLSTNEYKVVQVYYGTDYVESVGRVQVFTLGGGDGWRDKGEISYSFKEQAVFANSSLYWLDHGTECQQPYNIIAFDLADETFSVFPLPPCFVRVPGYSPDKQIHLVSLRGSLGAYHLRTAKSSSRYCLEQTNCMDIWTLKKEKKRTFETDDWNPWVWTLEFSMKYECWIDDPIDYEPFAITTSNKILLWGHHNSSLYCYDPNTLTVKKFWNESVPCARSIPHMNSFVSLKDLGESSSKRYALDVSKHDLDIQRKVFVENILGTSNGLIIEDLNVDITENILSHIPIECVSLGRAVCRLWRILLKKPKTGFLFAVSESQTHTEEIQIFHGYSEDVSIHDKPISHKTLTKVDLGLGKSRNIPVKLIRYGPVNPVIFGSCNGLVCLPVKKDETKCLVYICNPLTGEYVYLPEMDFGENSRPGVFGGFGYCQSTNEYKVVQVIHEYNQLELGRVHVYTLGGGCGWRNKGEIRHGYHEKFIFANEALYWIEHTEGVQRIRAFHLADESFGVLPMPPFHDGVRSYRHTLVSMNGCLCVYRDTVERFSEDNEDPSVRKEDIRMDMWILKEEHKKKKKNERYFPVDENDDSNPWVWIWEISMKYKSDIPYNRMQYEPFSITNKNQVLMWGVSDMFTFDYISPVCYDPNTAITTDLWNKGVVCAQAIPHMNSFVSLEDLGEKSARYTPDDN